MSSKIIPNQKFIESHLLSVFIGVVEKAPNRRSVHRTLQSDFARLAKFYGMEAVCEYRLKNYRLDGKDGLIDVVWMSGSTPIAAIEIDSGLRTKSIKKLLAVPTELKYWFYYGQKEPTSFVQKYDSDNAIRVIHKPFRTIKGADISVEGNYQPARDSVSLSYTSGLNSLFIINQHIHQAIQHCWATLSEEERSIEKLEQNMIRLVRRALQDIRDDVDAFGIRKQKEKLTAQEKLVQIRSRYPKAYKKWSKSEEEVLTQMYNEGANIWELSEKLQRQPTAVHSRLKKLGLI